MTAETEVSKQVVANAIGENCGQQISFSQDLPSSDCNDSSHTDQVSDPDNSYVFVTGADGLSDDPVDDREEGVVALSASGSIVEPEAAVEVQNMKLDVLNGEVNEYVEEVKIGNEGTNEVTSVVKGVGIDLEEERMPGDGKRGQVTIADAPNQQDGKIENHAVSEIKPVEDSNGRLESVARAALDIVTNQNEKLENVAESEIKQVEGPNGRLECAVVTQMEVVSDQNGNVGNVEVTEIKLIEDPRERIEGSEGAEISQEDHQNGISHDEAKSETKQNEDSIGKLEMVSDQNGNVGNVKVTEIKLAEDPNEIIEVSEGAEIRKGDHHDGNSQDEVKSEIKQVEDPIGTLDSSEGSDMVTDSNANLETVAEIEIKQVDPNLNFENVTEDEIKQVDYPNKKHESLGGAEMDTVRDQSTEIESLAGTDIKQVDVQNEVPESSEEGETEQVMGQKIDSAAEAELQTLENLIKPESSPAPIEDRESQVRDRGLLAKAEESCELSKSSLGFNESVNEKDEAEYQNNFGSTKTSEICQHSESVVEDPFDPELQEVSSKGQNDIKLSKEGVETLQHEVLPAISMGTNVETHPVNNNEETLEEQANVGLVSDVMENQNHEIVPTIQNGLQQVDEAELVVSGDGGHVETVCEETHEKDILVSHVEDTVQNDEEPEKPSDGGGVSIEGMQSETETEATLPTRSLPASIVHEPQSKVERSSAETTGTVSLSPVDGPQSQIVESGPSDHESQKRCTTNYASSESDSVFGMIVGGDAQVETELSSVKSEVVSSQTASVDVKFESELQDSGVATNEEMTSDVTDTCRIEVEAGLDVCNKGESDLVLETNVEDKGDQLDSAKDGTNKNLLLQGNEDTGNSQVNNCSVASPEDSGTDATSGGETSVAAVTKPFNYLIKVPRFNNESLKDRIRHAKLHVEEKTKLRDTIQFHIQQIRANCQIHGVDYESAKGENRNARKLVRSKRMEIDSLQSVINTAKNALSIEDVDTRIYSVEHMLQHETVPLKEEKQIIREIKQLKSLRDELSANMGSEEEIKQALEQREEAEEHLKILRKELEALKGEVSKTEAAATNAGMKYEDEHRKVKELQAQFRAANDVRQEAYARWLSLRKELSEKNKHFFKYKDDEAAATNYAFNRDRESVYRLCTDQVEKFMELWNTNEEFRKDYISFNTRSTARRFGTLDGRSLGPDEDPPIIPSYVDDRVHRVVSTPAEVDLVSQSPVELKSEATVENETLDDKSVKKVTEHKNQTVKTMKLLSNGLATFSSWADEVDEVQDEPVKSREEIEMDRKAEEMRKKEAEAKLKEQRRLEDLAKANEARERKKRQAEKVQMRAELKARKEAEEKEKEREKRLKKKERKKSGVIDSNEANNNSDSAPSSESAIETGREIDAKDMASVVAKKPSKYTKTNKKNSIPPPLRNRNRKKWQHYAYATAAGILVFVLFWVGNVGLFSNKTLKRPNTFY